MNMLEQFLKFIQNEQLISDSTGNGKREPLLLAVSGGVDSVVMCDLFFKANIPFAIGHCNFKLRGKESEQDEEFVKALAEKYKVSFHKKSFNTTSYAEKKKISIQMAARILRYEWLKRIANENGYVRIATAHHLDDSIETFFINILRGTGIAGLQGIPVKQENIIRPLLFATKKMIYNYAETNNLSWREDSSNLTDSYLRNTIRHHVIPALKKLNKGFEKTITRELSYFKEVTEIFKKFIDEKKKEIIVTEGRDILLNIKKLKESSYPKTLLHEILRAYDFTPETTELIAQHLYTTAGKKFLSPTYRLIKDRDFFILTPQKSQKSTTIQKTSDFPETQFIIEKNQKEFQHENLNLRINILKGNISTITNKSPKIAWLDMDTLNFPLTLRKWKEGDSFQPLGMKGKKKLSDFFTDIKLPINKKEETWVLLSSGNIVWVVGYRIDDRFKITDSTRKIYRIELL
jgi:tRNA(Ile)-lysidine synthase